MVGSGYIWANIFTKEEVSALPTDWGWSTDWGWLQETKASALAVAYTTKPEISRKMIQLHMCGCHNGNCAGRCSYTKNAVPCTHLGAKDTIII